MIGFRITYDKTKIIFIIPAALVLLGFMEYIGKYNVPVLKKQQQQKNNQITRVKVLGS